MNIDKKAHIIFITALEMPSISNLHASQVLAPASQISEKGYMVSWIAYIPLAMYIKDKILFTKRIQSIQKECAKNNIKFYYFITISPSNASILSFILKKTLFLFKKNKAIQIIGTEKTLLHARSYYATDIAIRIKQCLPKKNSCKVSFDMRSIFPEEMPITSSTILGRMTLGFMKQWEFELLRDSDVAFLPLHYARSRIYSETGTKVRYTPVQGFDRESGWKADFEKRWEQARLGYAGSIGAWHSPEILLNIFQALPWMKPRLAMKPHPLFAHYDCRVYANNDMSTYYDDLLGLAIPGMHDADDYFMTFKIRCNFFSTKAAEALSRGVPLIVSSGLFELAKFVRNNRCGFIYDPDSRQFVFPGPDSIAEKGVWAEMTRNAVTVGEKFTRANVVSAYLDCWASLFQKEENRS